MPARREYTPEELQARLERRREQTRQAVARHRQRQVSTTVMLTGEQVSLTPGQGTPRKPNPPTPPVLSSSLLEKIKTKLAPFAGRGYQHDPAFWEVMAAEYPGVALVVEAYNMASWLKKPLKKNREALCSEGFIINWLKKAQGDADARKATPPPAGAPKGLTVNGVYHPPASMQRTPDPELPAVPWAATGLARFSPEEEARMRQEQARVHWQDRLKAKANGVHKA